ncbi:MAG: YceD family protein [Solirubrobacteraceae bacterium]
MPQRTDSFALDRLALRSGEGRRFDLHVPVADLRFGDARYAVRPDPMPVRFDVSRTTHAGYALRLRFDAELEGPCMRCLQAASPHFEIDVREISVPGGGEELQSPYLDATGDLDLFGWTRDALALAVPDQITCRPDCAGLCPICGEDRNADPGHAHEREPDPRWAKLRELKLD